MAEPEVRIEAGARAPLFGPLYDAAGRKYTPDSETRQEDKPPTFAVFKNGQALDTGSFEYG